MIRFKSKNGEEGWIDPFPNHSCFKLLNGEITKVSGNVVEMEEGANYVFALNLKSAKKKFNEIQES